MKLDYLKNSWRIYLKNFGKLFSFTISILILFLASFTFYLLLSSFDLGLTAIIIFAAGVVPFFYCLQMMIAKVSAGEKIEYNEYYYPYKAYFSPVNRGNYSIIFTLFFTLIMMYVSLFFSFFLYDIFHYGAFDEIFKNIDMSIGYLSYQEYFRVINEIINLPNYIYYLIVCMVIPFMFFFNRIKNRLMISYFKLVMPLPNIIINSINKKLLKLKKNFIKENCFLSNLIFIGSFTLGFIIFGIISSLFGDYLPDIAYIFIIALGGGLILSSFFLPPVLINYCFIADHIHADFLELVKNEMLSLSSSIGESDPEKKELIEKMLNLINQNDEKDN